jgi:hypothetical protein
MIPKKANSLYKEVSEDLSIDQTLVEDCIEFYYKEIRQQLTNLTYPRINVPGLGHFVIKKTVVDRDINRFNKALEDHDTSTFTAYYNKKTIEAKLDLLVKMQEMIVKEENKKENLIKKRNEEYTKTNLGQPETDN